MEIWVHSDLPFLVLCGESTWASKFNTSIIKNDSLSTVCRIVEKAYFRSALLWNHHPSIPVSWGHQFWSVIPPEMRLASENQWYSWRYILPGNKKLCVVGHKSRDFLPAHMDVSATKHGSFFLPTQVFTSIKQALNHHQRMGINNRCDIALNSNALHSEMSATIQMGVS